MECPHCFQVLDPRASVCRGCGSTLLRGTSAGERKVAALSGLFLGAIFGGSMGGPGGAFFGAMTGLVLCLVVAQILLGRKQRWVRNYHQ
jgi:hypothetical protein